MTKRIFDIGVSFAALLVLGVPMLLVALVVRLTSRGPALHWSDRVGRENKIFKMPKFRTMRADTPPMATHLMMRAFLKIDDFLLTSYNYFNQFGLGLTQVYSAALVYNHKRAGEYMLGGKRFEFRLAPAYPDKLSREFLLVDLLNNLKRLPDNTAGVLENVKNRLNEFDGALLTTCLRVYGRPGAKRAFREIYA